MVKLVYAVLFGCIMVVGLPLNAVSLWILLRRHNLKSPNVVFMVNLAISDLLLVISLPLRVYVYATGTWPLSTTACTLVTVLFRSNIRSSFIFITFISVDRLLAVVYPLKSRHLRTSSNAWRAVALIWMFILVSNIPEGLASSRIPCNNSEPTCFEFCRHPSRPPVYFQTVLVFAMLAVNVACTVLVTWTLRRNLNESVRVHNKVNVMMIFVMNLVMFSICFLPLSVGILIITDHSITPLIWLAIMNCCLDPVLYYFSLGAFWKKEEDVDLAREQ